MLRLRAAVILFNTLQPDQPLMLVREPTNPADTNAILLTDLFGKPCGYLAREEAAICAPLLDRGVVLMCKVIAVPRVVVWRDGDTAMERRVYHSIPVMLEASLEDERYSPLMQDED